MYWKYKLKMFVEDIKIKNHTYYFFDYIIKLKEFDPIILNQIKSYIKIFLCSIRSNVTYVAIKD